MEKILIVEERILVILILYQGQHLLIPHIFPNFLFHYCLMDRRPSKPVDIMVTVNCSLRKSIKMKSTVSNNTNIFCDISYNFFLMRESNLIFNLSGVSKRMACLMSRSIIFFFSKMYGVLDSIWQGVATLHSSLGPERCPHAV